MNMLATYQPTDSIGTITMDDGKVNVLSTQMLSDLNGAFDQALADRAVVVLTGREGVFSAGFDLKVMRAGGLEASAMLRAGFELAERMLSFPTPVVIACPGHAIAMGLFLLLSGDYRVGAAGHHKFTANEVALGLTMPRTAVEICRQRLTPAYFNRTVIIAEPCSVDDVVAAGILDRVVPAAELQKIARDTAAQLVNLDMAAHAATKLRAREPALKAIRAAIDDDVANFQAMRGGASA